MKLIVICGATATGKSDIALQIALEIGAEIINADSMQLYRGMDIGTAKLAESERQSIPHHLLDVLSVSEDSTVAWYQEKARALVTEIHARGKNVVVVGGTGLYIKALLDDLNFPEKDPAVREKLEAQALEFGAQSLFERLQQLDPAAALAIDRANTRRVIRALEVIEITGKPFTANLPREDSTQYPDAIQFGLVMEREHLRNRIDQRVDLMWEKGFVAEVDELLNDGILDGVTAQRAIGYSSLIAMRAGTMSEDEAKEETKRATRQYARRQETWFSRDQRINWISPISDRFATIMQKINS
ncbi:MAG: tRNA (adenosine(37)-N6)-dimethylallyltransferase MiaA [Actinobacteria bacterium]|uniref:tRNA dimethylallyltransferase n=1 Tax=freshwater metagenome TaxID=449393 RepID=A0A6J5Z977_9ZZZZ|nr:tRNA (adenosine(37)-N6)-dimethylallyltransferase MiaA [Actinomycetota bacterium]